jgi:tRNA1(Val) A37 N6-methylase TrmN6
MNTQNEQVPSTETAATEDALLDGRVRLLQPRRGYRVAVDAVLLAAAIPVQAGERVLDLGAGVAAVGLCLARRVPGVQVVGIELQPSLIGLARRNSVLNGLSEAVRTVEHDLAAPLPGGLGTFQHVSANPPYLPAAVADPSPDPVKALATVESSAGLARWLEVAAAAATDSITLIHRRDRLEEIVAGFVRTGWGDIALQPLAPAQRVLVRARRSAVARRHQAMPLVLHQADGSYTTEAEAILRHAAPLAF